MSRKSNAWLDDNILFNNHSSKPHSTPKADGRRDPLHAKLRITEDRNRPITSAHAYAKPLGDRLVWFSRFKFNLGQEAKQHFPHDPEAERTAPPKKSVDKMAAKAKTGKKKRAGKGSAGR